ncbi:MAG: DUF4124 domain-containing protein [Gallionellaceae bacterium]|nr:DUF4124 domain-containing protein [Gallionellaceae bacterium]MDD5364056.1 DUF4124 domain-containing protein [Gallionellaceae bacterium]
MIKVFLTLLLTGLALPAQAVIYKYVDADGNVTFSDRYRPGAVKFIDDGKGHAISTSRKHRGNVGPSPANFPRVDRQTQNKRDDIRRTLLLEERGNEEKSLAATRANLASGKQRPAVEQNRLIENQRLHEKNIEMLDKELARIK